MATVNLERIIDGDGHIFEDAEAISSFMPAGYTRRGSIPASRLFPALDHLHAANLHETPAGSFRNVGPEGWLGFLDEVGIDSTVLYPTSGLAYGKIVNLDWAIDVTRAYNDWLHQTYLKKSSRFNGMALIPMQNPEAAVVELRRAVEELGMCGGMLPSTGLTAHLGSKQYWPVYREADRLGCCLAIHGGCHSGLGLDDMNVYPAVNALGHPLGIAIAFAGIIFNGLLEKFPNARFAFLEGGIGWFIMALERFQRSYETHVPYDPRKEFIQLEEGENVTDYIRKHIKNGRIFIGCEGDEPALGYAVSVVGSDPFVYSSDFPHEVNTVTCREELNEILENEQLTATDKEAILHKNAERLYRL